jgi:hypothetical protein
MRKNEDLEEDDRVEGRWTPKSYEKKYDVLAPTEGDYSGKSASV